MIVVCVILLFFFNIGDATRSPLQDIKFTNELASGMKECMLTEYSNCDEVIYNIKIIKQWDVWKSLKFRPFDESSVATVGSQKYHQLFQDFIAQHRAFKGREIFDKAGLDNCKQYIVVKEQNSVFGDSSLSSLNCSFEFIPKIIKNSYFLKINASTFERNSKFGINYISHWPSLVHLLPNVPTKVFTCPLSLNQYLLNIGENSVRVRLFPNSAVLEFDPVVEFDEGSDIPFPHIFFGRSGFPGLEDSSSEKKRIIVPKYNELVLSPGEYAFIPESVLVSIVTETDTFSAVDVMRYCFVDASNLNSVRQFLGITAGVSVFDRELLRSLVNGIDFRMEMNPEAAAAEVAGTVTDNESTVTSSRSRKRSGASTASNRDWVESKLWEKLIQSLTLIPPTLIGGNRAGRNNITIEWYSGHYQDPKDSSRFGFNVTVCLRKNLLLPYELTEDCSFAEYDKADYSGLRWQLDSGLTARDGVDTYKYSVVLSGLKPNQTYNYYVSMYVGSTSSNPSSWSSIITTKALSAPSMIPDLVTVKELLLGSIASDDKVKNKKKKKSLVRRTFSVEGIPVTATEVMVDFHVPLDDGGAAISEYSVYGRVINASLLHLPSGWSVYPAVYASSALDLGGFQGLRLTNLFAGLTYEFKVAALNAFGEGPWSEISNPVTTPNYDENTHTVLRRSDFNRLFPSTAAVVHLSIIQQKLLLLDSSSQRELLYISSWKCNWSPRVDVISRIVEATPLLGNTEILNSDELYGNIAIVLRGEIPLVYKIRRLQLAGASGVIVVDDGQCIAFNQNCIPGSEMKNNEGFASHDSPDIWYATNAVISFYIQCNVAAQARNTHPCGAGVATKF